MDDAPLDFASPVTPCGVGGDGRRWMSLHVVDPVPVGGSFATEDLGLRFPRRGRRSAPCPSTGLAAVVWAGGAEAPAPANGLVGS